ncbi:hypothetical protein LCGC14_3112120 [marine sediment metagenome]|uniref:Uncharacterized protein n=1 Tax=marine sediment metagenome TaxID=412755 RepID=A0A0F8W4S5_9ZZZZ
MLALKTFQNTWYRLDNFLDATDASGKSAAVVGARALADFSALTTYFVYKEVPASINMLETRFLGVANNDDYTVDVHAGRMEQGKAEMARVCTLTLKCGQQTSDWGALLYIDTITITNNLWLKTVASVEPGTDQQARLIFDPCGYNVVGFYGYSTFDGDCYVEISGY